MDYLGNQANTGKNSNNDRDSNEELSVLDIVFEKAGSSAVKNQKPTKNDVECIFLDDSDSDNIEVLHSRELTKLNIFFPSIKKELKKKIDYLHLDSSDTDDEQERIQNNVNDLLCSAAILNDIECGPKKPEINRSITLSSCMDDSSVSGKRSCSPSLAVNDHDDSSTKSSVFDICGDKVSSQKDISSKKIKPCLPTINIIDVNVCNVKGFVPRNSMYRKDDMILEAYKKKDISKIPSTLSQKFSAHGKALSSLRWCAVPHSHLLLSSSLDCTVKIWDIYSQNNPIEILTFPFSVRAAKWSKNGEQIITGGFGKQAHVIDTLSGKTHMVYKISNNVSCVTIHPFLEDVVLCGTHNAIFGFDLRVDSELPVRSFLSKCGEVLDIAFLNKNEFVCSTSIVSHDSADRTIMVWDFNSAAIMSNQIFLERYTCPSLKVNSFDSSFIAQTNGDYIASFASQRPYKIKNKRYVGHKVSGFGVECDISSNGQYVASGDAKGDVYFYNYADTKLVNKLNIKPDVAINKVQWHPVLPSAMAVATWDGQIHVWK